MVFLPLAARTIYFCCQRRFKSDTPPLHLPNAYAAGAVSRLLFTMPAAR